MGTRGVVISVLFLACVLILVVGCQVTPVATSQPAPQALPSVATPLSPTPSTVRPPTRVGPSVPYGFMKGTIQIGDLSREYSYYAPENLPRNAPLLFAFHGSGESAQTIRDYMGYRFEKMADENGFLVLYPEGFMNSWNDCRKSSPLAAKKNNIDDIAFIRSLITQFHTAYGIDRSRIFATGWANGAHFTFRLALELPTEINAIAAVTANLSTDADSDCRVGENPIAVLIMNGTSDPYNPYDGGKAVRGDMLRSAKETAEYFARLNGLVHPPETARLPHLDATDRTSVDRTTWSYPGKREVVLLTINGGGHEVPGWKKGGTTKDLDGPAEIWSFFSRQPSLK